MPSDKKKKSTSNVDAIAPFLGTAGSLLQSGAMTQDRVNVGATTTGGLMQGIAAGSKFGPWGAAAGALIGAGAGFVSGAKRRTAQEERDAEIEMLPFLNAKDPDISFALKGGVVVQGNADNVALQAEEDEQAVFPSGNIAEVKANKKHKDMPKDEVTDFVPSGTYIASEDDSMTLTKEDIEGIVVGIGPIVYEDGADKTSKINKMYLSDILDGDMTPAEAMRRIKKRMPVVDRDGDPLVVETNKENIAARLPYIQAVIMLAEEKKAKKEAGKKKKKGEEPEANIPMAQDGLLAEYSKVAEMNKEERERMRQLGLDINDRILRKRNTSNALNAFQGTALNFLQDPTETPALLTTQGLEEAYKPRSRSAIDIQESKIDRTMDTAARAASRSGVASPAEILANLGPIAQSTQDSKVSLALDTLMRDEDAERKLNLARNDVRNKNIIEIADKKNAERTNVNRQLRNQRRTLENYLTQNSNAVTDALENEYSIESQASQNERAANSDAFSTKAYLSMFGDNESADSDNPQTVEEALSRLTRSSLDDGIQTDNTSTGNPEINDAQSVYGDDIFSAFPMDPVDPIFDSLPSSGSRNITTDQAPFGIDRPGELQGQSDVVPEYDQNGQLIGKTRTTKGDDGSRIIERFRVGPDGQEVISEIETIDSNGVSTVDYGGGRGTDQTNIMMRRTEAGYPSDENQFLMSDEAKRLLKMKPIQMTEADREKILMLAELYPGFRDSMRPGMYMHFYNE